MPARCKHAFVERLIAIKFKIISQIAYIRDDPRHAQLPGSAPEASDPIRPYKLYGSFDEDLRIFVNLVGLSEASGAQRMCFALTGVAAPFCRPQMGARASSGRIIEHFRRKKNPATRAGFEYFGSTACAALRG
jgi:hypothetical protein